MKKKNVLSIFTDQQRFDTIAAAGNPHIKTPNLDRLCRDGTRFSAAYTPSPVCVPARCSMHYGQYPMNTGCFENNYDMPTGRPSVADVLTAAGYRTHCIGKRHFTPDPEAARGFQTLENTGQLDNTLIIFASDHGEFLGDYNCFGKRSFLDSAARIPLICRLPGTFEAGAVCDTPVSLVDIMPTALAVAGIKEIPSGGGVPEGRGGLSLDGEDLEKVAGGSSSRDVVFGHYQGSEAGIYMAVSKHWKYIWSAADHKELLFDRIKDPQELRNRAHNVACGDAVRRMRTLLQNHIRTMPGHENVVDDNGWIVKEPITLPDDPDAGLIVQDPPCYLDRLHIPGYSDHEIAGEDATGADFDPLAV